MPNKNDPGNIFRVYQRMESWQRVFVMIPTSVNAWVDSCLHSCFLGTRFVRATWRARAGSGSPTESWEDFGKRISDIRVMFILDESITIHQRIYVSVDKETPIIPVQKEVALRNDEETWLRFPMDGGRIQIHLAGAQPNDLGIIRIEFLVPLVAPDDNMIIPHTMDCVELYGTDPQEFPEPREPNPFAEVKLSGKS